MQRILQAVKYEEKSLCVNPLVIKSLCCKRAFLRGAFLGIGSMSNPEKGYHLEFVCENDEQAMQIQGALADFDIEGKVVQRKRYLVVYIKESEGIVELLNVMGAHQSLMSLENLRILKDMRNKVNRRVNCETANINKTVSAAVKQVEDIEYIDKHKGLRFLDQGLQDIARLRLEHPEATLKELGDMLEPPVGKSGVNHRLKKIGRIAEEIRLGGQE